MTRVALVAALLLSGSSLAAQKAQVNAGAQFAFGDYKETAEALPYQGGGVGFWVGFGKGKLSVDGSFLAVSYQPVAPRMSTTCMSVRTPRPRTRSTAVTMPAATPSRSRNVAPASRRSV